ncbi:MAG: hypothetical protein KGK08_10660 [Acidobacteriota bacterium]|nr:hypothetical protein [Acidobacteriota bacterium]
MRMRLPISFARPRSNTAETHARASSGTGTTRLTVGTRFAHTLLCFALLTSSFDLTLVLNIGGTLRATQLAFALAAGAGLLLVLQRGEFRMPAGYSALLIWGILQTTVVPFSVFLPKGIAYNAWLWVTILSLGYATQLYTRPALVHRLIHFYLISFIPIAIFGMYQFMAPLFGLPDFFVGQWWFYPKLARINGFSYEPSYFATYMLLGWVMLLDLIQRKHPRYSTRPWRMVFALESIVMILSSSRSAWIFMSLECVVRFGPAAMRRIWIHVQRLRYGRWRLSKLQLLAVPVLVLLAFITPHLGQIVQDYDLLFLLQGTGIGGTAAHSVSDRSNGVLYALRVFLHNPLLGCSLGGVSGNIAQLQGTIPKSIEDSKLYEATAIFPEVLAASGLIGFIPFCIFVYQTTWLPLRRSAFIRGLPFSMELHALARAMIFEWLILQASQNILRPYVWLHITVVCIVMAQAKPKAQVGAATQPIAA